MIDDLEGLKFKEFFAWLSQSVSTISDSMPGDKILLPPTEGWETLMEMWLYENAI